MFKIFSKFSRWTTLAFYRTASISDQMMMNRRLKKAPATKAVILAGRNDLVMTSRFGLS